MTRTSLLDLPVIDVDSHLTEPPDLWTSRAPAAYRERVPRMVRTPKGRDFWMIDGDRPFSTIGVSVVRRDGSKTVDSERVPTFDAMDPAVADPAARLRRLDALGITAQVIYPNVAGFGNTNFMRIKDDGLRLVCTQLYNDAIAEIQAQGAGRLYPQGVTPFWEIPAATAELRRIKDLGLSGIAMADRPDTWGLPPLHDAAWDPFWSACQELELPVNFHIGAGGLEFGANTAWGFYSEQKDRLITSVGFFLDNFRAVINLIFSGMLERYPRLKFVSVESGVGWIPFVLEACEYQFDELMSQDREGLTLRPTEYFRRQIFGSYWFEAHGLRSAVEYVGPDNIMFETDFPHPTSLYPNVREQIQRSLAGFDDDTRRKVLYGNAAKLYGIPV
jgi:predicted TIM-barrel fold metal-dependent hydrolase